MGRAERALVVPRDADLESGGGGLITGLALSGWLPDRRVPLFAAEWGGGAEIPGPGAAGCEDAAGPDGLVGLDRSAKDGDADGLEAFASAGLAAGASAAAPGGGIFPPGLVRHCSPQLLTTASNVLPPITAETMQRAGW